jgi:hypothetical protein
MAGKLWAHTSNAPNTGDISRSIDRISIDGGVVIDRPQTESLEVGRNISLKHARESSVVAKIFFSTEKYPMKKCYLVRF